MPNAWFLQANPQQYDIDAALKELDVISWRVPQYTAEIRPSDVIVVWRAGPEAGIVAVGNVLAAPAESSPRPEEARYQAEASENDDLVTRAPIRLRAVPFVPKIQVASHPALRDHRIVVAPMGTVFPIAPHELTALRDLIPALDDIRQTPAAPASGAAPRPFSWNDRLKAVHPLPGGYDQYLSTLKRILARVHQVRPERGDLEKWICEDFALSESFARFVVDFLVRVTILVREAGKVDLSAEAAHWLTTQDHGFLIGLIHSRVRFVGEMLEVLRTPKTPDELLAVANDLYELGWTTRAQIDRRRGWLQSAGLVELLDNGAIGLTENGRRILTSLEIHPPLKGASLQPDGGASSTKVLPRRPKPSPPSRQKPRSQVAIADDLIARLSRAAHDTSAPDEFEQIAAEAFAFLGFESTWLGGAGKTDVLLVAELGPSEGYRVILDCKTTAKDAVPDQQIDWLTLTDHRTAHEADHVVVLGAAFQSSRVKERAASQGVLLLDVNALSELLAQHARMPLGLEVYRQLFRVADAAEGVALLAESAEESTRWLRLAAEIVRLVRRLEGEEGPITGRDLYWNLRGLGDELGAYTAEEIEGVLETLSAPSLRILRRLEDGYKSLGSLQTTAERLRLLAGMIDPDATATREQVEGE